MKIPYSWLKELLPGVPSAHELEPLLAQLGLPVEEIVDVPAPPAGVLYGEVLTCEPMEGTQLHKLTVNVGEEQTIVTGAPNARAGVGVAVVAPGVTLGEVTYGIRKMQGIDSWGMCASAKELGIGEGASGLLLLPLGTARPGVELKDLWAADEVLDVEVTPNRADALSVLGVARDLAAYLNLELVLPSKGLEPQGAGEVKLTVTQEKTILHRDPENKPRLGCDHFVARTVSGAQNGPSPLWLQRRLMLAGMRPINAIVDISNYVMLELGQPTAFYDARDLPGKEIVVNYAGNETAKALDGADHELIEGQDAVIRNGEGQVIGIAGIMGGHLGRVVDDTRDVVIEAAHFDPVRLRRTSTRLGLKTDAVYRYERGVDPSLPLWTANRIAELLRDVTGATVHDGATIVDHREPIQDILLDADYARRLLGLDIDIQTMKEVLEKLGATVTLDGNTLRITPPSWRIDMLIPEDAIEEVARIYGYDKLNETLPSIQVNEDNIGADRESRLRREVKQVFSGLGFQEVVTYTFTNVEEAKAARAPEPVVELRNPLTSDRTHMRTALYPSLLKVAQTNKDEARLLIFEVGHIFPKEGESERLGALMRGPLATGNWQKGIQSDFYTFKALIESVAGTLGADFQLKAVKENAPEYLHPGIVGEVFWNGQSIGHMGQVHPAVAFNLGLKADLYLLDVQMPLPGREWTFSDVNRNPAALRDLAIIASKSVSYGEIEDLIHAHGGSLLEKVDVFDVYSGAPIPEGQRSIAVRLTYRGSRTLQDTEVNTDLQNLIASLKTAGLSIREQ